MCAASLLCLKKLVEIQPFEMRINWSLTPIIFDPRNYGFSQLSKLMRKQEYLDVKEVPMGDGSTNVHFYVRQKVGTVR